MELNTVLQLKPSALGLLKDGSFLIVFITRSKKVAKMNCKAVYSVNLVCRNLQWLSEATTLSKVQVSLNWDVCVLMTIHADNDWVHSIRNKPWNMSDLPFSFRPSTQRTHWKWLGKEKQLRQVTRTSGPGPQAARLCSRSCCTHQKHTVLSTDLKSMAAWAASTCVHACVVFAQPDFVASASWENRTRPHRCQ